MKSLNIFLKNKQIVKNKKIDQETVFYIFKKIIKKKYGEVGFLNIKPDYYKGGKIFLIINSSNWSNEVWLNKKMIIKEINDLIGENEIKDIKVKK